MKQQEVDHINHCAQAVKGLRRAKRHVFQNCPDDVFRVHIRNKHHLCKIPLEAAMKKHNIHVEHSSTSTSGMALSACRCQSSQSGYALNVSSSSHSHEWLIDSGASYHMAKNKAMFSSLDDCNTKNIYVGDDRSLNVVGTGTFI